MIIKQLGGGSELLTDHSPAEIHERINSEYSLSFTVYRTDYNRYMYDMVKEENIVLCDGQQFTIKNIDETAVGTGANKLVTAEHIFFSLIDYRILYEQFIDDDISIFGLMHLIFLDNGFTFEVQGQFETQYVEDIQPQNHLEFVNWICNLYKAEIVRDNKHIIFVNKIGSETFEQIRYGHNLKTINRTINTSNLATVQIGYMDGNLDEAYEYVSPLVNVFGRRIGEPVMADDIFEEEELMKLLKDTIQDYPDISYAIEVQGGKFGLGDTVITIWEPLDIDIITRIVEQTRYPENNISPTVTIANVKLNAVDILADFGKSKQNIDRVIDNDGHIKLSAMNAQVLRSTYAIENSMTELEYPEFGGIIGRDKINPNNYTVFNSGGFGIFKDGLAVEAITVNGFNLSVGVIGRLTAENIDTVGLSVDAAYVRGKLTANQIDATSLQVQAANVTGKLTAYQIDASSLSVNAAYIYGKLTADQIDASSLSVNAANIQGTLTAGQINTDNLKVKAANITGALTAYQIDATNLAVNAAYIYGKLTANQIDASSLKVSAVNVTGVLSASQIATNELIVGTNISMGPNARISWGNVTNQPWIPQSASAIGAMPTATYIDAYGVYTGEIYASKIRTGTLYGMTISGGNINVASDVRVGSKIILQGVSSGTNGLILSEPRNVRLSHHSSMIGSTLMDTVTLNVNGGKFDIFGDVDISEGLTCYSLRVTDIASFNYLPDVDGDLLATQAWVTANFAKK